MFSQDLSDEEELLPQRQIKRHTAEVPVVLSPEEVTEDDIKNVAQKSGGKIYSSERGTCCHQCRYLNIQTQATCLYLYFLPDGSHIKGSSHAS